MDTIGIIGSGDVAKALAAGFLRQGAQVMMGTRDPKKLSDWASKAGDKAKVGTFAEAARAGKTLVLAVKGSAAEDALQQAGPENFAGKTVLDTTNPIADAPPDNG